MLSVESNSSLERLLNTFSISRHFFRGFQQTTIENIITACGENARSEFGSVTVSRPARVGLMTWWLGVRYPVKANFLSGVFSPLTSAEACEKSSRWLWKKFVSTGVRKPGNTCASPTAMI